MSIPKSPLVSICIPTFNRSSYVVRAVQSALSQTFSDIEVIVSDNCSPDDTWERLQSFNDLRLRLIRQVENIGMIPNLNVCLNQARGDLFLLLSDDDALEPSAIEQLSEPFRKPIYGLEPPIVGLTWAPYFNIDNDGKTLWTTQGGPKIESPVSLVTGLANGTRGPQLSAVLIRTRDALAVGGYNDERYGAACDTGNWARVAMLYRYIVCVQEPLMRYTVHAPTAPTATTSASYQKWQGWISNLADDTVALARENQGTAAAEQLIKAKRNWLANITSMVLLRYFGKPGWIKLYVAEFWRSRRFMLTPFVAKRLLKDGWKLFRQR